MAAAKTPIVQKRRRYADATGPRLVTPPRKPALPAPVLVETEPERRVVTRDPRTNEVIE
jgi:hypothetical protein